MKNKIGIIAIMAILMLASVMAASTMETDRLNFYDSELHTVILTNDEGGVATATITIPVGWTYGTSGDCSEAGGVVTCASIANQGIATFTVNSPSSGAGEYSLHTMNGTMGSTTLTDLHFVRILDKEIFLTLVEFGRGKSCYFYSSEGLAGSGQDQAGYNYVPSNSSFELNWLHKMYPTTNNYLGYPTADGQGISFSCSYPNQSVTKEHLITSLDIGATADATFSADLLTNSWERVFWITQVYDEGEYADGETITINCTSINYRLPEANGNISIDENSFQLEFASPYPVSIAASSIPTTIGNGTSEVEITYTLTNNEAYPLSAGKDPAQFEILSPDLATFIGTRGELWGVGQDSYVWEIPSLPGGASAQITLVARFDTSGSTDTSLNLTRGVNAVFVPTWQLNCYNPQAITQVLGESGTVSVNYGQESAIVGVQDYLTNIYDALQFMNGTINNINSTSNQILTYVVDINGTVTDIQSTVNTIEVNTVDINNTVNNIYTDTQTIIEQLDCDTVADTPICQYVLDINNTVNSNNQQIGDILNLVTEINMTTWTSYFDMQNNFSDVFNQFNTLQLNISQILTEIDIAQDYLNCTIATQDSVCYRLGLLETYSLEINQTTQNNYNNILYLNNTLLPNINQSIINNINNLNLNQSNDINNIRTSIRQLKEFEEESIYLITDSMVESQQAALSSFQNVDTEATIQHLEETNTLLSALKARIDRVQATTEPVTTATTQVVVQQESVIIKFLRWVDSFFNSLGL